MKVTIEPPTDRNVTITLTEAQARLLSRFLGRQSISDFEHTLACPRPEAHDLQVLYFELANALR